MAIDQTYKIPEPRPDVAQLSRAIEVLSADATEVPTEIRLFTSGPVETTKGTFQFSAKSAEAVLSAHADYGNDLMFDYDHAAMQFFSMDPAESGKAAGFFTPAVRNGELWATNIKWTPPAKQKLLNREFRYVSPTFRHDEEGEVLELINAALTNMPATKRMAPIMASRKAEEKPAMTPEMLAMLGLKAEASPAEALAVIQALKAGAQRAEELSAKVAELEKVTREAEVSSLIEAGKTAGQIPPALVEWAKAQGPEALKAFLAVAPKLAPTAPVSAPAPKAGEAPVAELSQDELEFIGRYNLTKEAFLKSKAAVAARKAVDFEAE